MLNVWENCKNKEKDKKAKISAFFLILLKNSVTGISLLISA